MLKRLFCSAEICFICRFFKAATFLGSADFPEQLFWGDWGLGLCSEAHGEACPEFGQSRLEPVAGTCSPFTRESCTALGEKSRETGAGWLLVVWPRSVTRMPLWNSVTPGARAMAAGVRTTLDCDTVEANIPSLFRGPDVIITACGCPEKAAGAMQAFFNTTDTDSGLGAGTILGGCLGLPPVKETGLGCTKVKQGWGGPAVGGRVTGGSARPQGDTEGVGWWVVMTRPWLWLKVVADASWVRVAEAVCVMTEGDLLAPANFGCRKVDGAEGLKAGAGGGGAKGRAGEAGAGAGLGDSKGMVNTGRKG